MFSYLQFFLESIPEGNFKEGHNLSKVDMTLRMFSIRMKEFVKEESFWFNCKRPTTHRPKAFDMFKQDFIDRKWHSYWASKASLKRANPWRKAKYLKMLYELEMRSFERVNDETVNAKPEYYLVMGLLFGMWSGLQFTRSMSKEKPWAVVQSDTPTSVEYAAANGVIFRTTIYKMNKVDDDSYRRPDITRLSPAESLRLLIE
jgi:hypothetical protein